MKDRVRWNPLNWNPVKMMNLGCYLIALSILLEIHGWKLWVGGLSVFWLYVRAEE